MIALSMAGPRQKLERNEPLISPSFPSSGLGTGRRQAPAWRPATGRAHDAKPELRVSAFPSRSLGTRGQGKLPFRHSSSMVVVVMALVAVTLVPAGGRGLEDAVERPGRVAGDVQARPDAAVVGQHDVAAVLEQHADRPALEEVAVLAEDVDFRPLAHDRL